MILIQIGQLDSSGSRGRTYGRSTPFMPIGYLPIGAALKTLSLNILEIISRLQAVEPNIQY